MNGLVWKLEYFLHSPGHFFFQIKDVYLGVSKNRGTPKWMVERDNPMKMDDLGVPLFLETPIWNPFLVGFHDHAFATIENLRISWASQLGFTEKSGQFKWTSKKWKGDWTFLHPFFGGM